MKFTPEIDISRIIRHVVVEDGPTLLMEGSARGSDYKVDHIAIEYELDNDGAWRVANGSKITLGGYVIRRDGTVGKMYHEGRAPYEWASIEWLTDLVDRMRP